MAKNNNQDSSQAQPTGQNSSAGQTSQADTNKGRIGTSITLAG